MFLFHQEVLALTGLNLNEQQLGSFELFEEQLIKWNESFNLTAISDPESIRRKHFLDSLSSSLLIDGHEINRLIDIGTGAGFPGFPLKIVFPHLQLVLVESIGKKADFCRFIAKHIALDQTAVYQTRAEELGQSALHREMYDCAVARAVANMSTLAEYMLPLVRLGGYMLSLKGESGPREAHAAEKAITLFGGHIKQIREVQIPGIAEERYLILIEKIATTPDKYPRRVGVPLKRPIK